MPESFSLVTLAGRHGRKEGHTVVILEIESYLDPLSIDTAFPSLDDGQLDIVENGPLVMSYEGLAEAQEAFNAFTRQAVEGLARTHGKLVCTVTYVGEVRGMRASTHNEVGPGSMTDLHLFEDGTIVNEPR